MEDSKPLHIVIAPEDKKEFLDLCQIARIYSERLQRISPFLVHRMLELMWDINEYKDNLMFQEAQHGAKEAAEKIEIIKGLDLVWKFRKGFNDDELIKPDNRQIFMEMMYAFFLFQKDHKKTGKDEAIAFFHSAIEEYYYDELEDQCKKQLTSYKKGTVAGILAMAAGFQLTPNPNPSAKDIYQATRNAIKKNIKDDYPTA